MNYAEIIFEKGKKLNEIQFKTLKQIVDIFEEKKIKYRQRWGEELKYLSDGEVFLPDSSKYKTIPSNKFHTIMFQLEKLGYIEFLGKSRTQFSGDKKYNWGRDVEHDAIKGSYESYKFIPTKEAYQLLSIKPT
jgi:hypothetical protein